MHLLFSRGELKILTPLRGVPPRTTPRTTLRTTPLKINQNYFQDERYKKCTWEITFSHHIGYRYFWGPIPSSLAGLPVKEMATTELDYHTVGI